jgi:hypothetical protein
MTTLSPWLNNSTLALPWQMFFDLIGELRITNQISGESWLVGLSEGRPWRGTSWNWENDLESWLKSFLDHPGHKARRRSLSFISWADWPWRPQECCAHGE